MLYALFEHGCQISKGHSTRDAAVIEAIERGLVASGRGDLWFMDGVTIELIKDEENAHSR